MNVKLLCDGGKQSFGPHPCSKDFSAKNPNGERERCVGVRKLWQSARTPTSPGKSQIGKVPANTELRTLAGFPGTLARDSDCPIRSRSWRLTNLNSTYHHESSVALFDVHARRYCLWLCRSEKVLAPAGEGCCGDREENVVRREVASSICLRVIRCESWLRRSVPEASPAAIAREYQV